MQSLKKILLLLVNWADWVDVTLATIIRQIIYEMQFHPIEDAGQTTEHDPYFNALFGPEHHTITFPLVGVQLIFGFWRALFEAQVNEKETKRSGMDYVVERIAKLWSMPNGVAHQQGRPIIPRENCAAQTNHVVTQNNIELSEYHKMQVFIQFYYELNTILQDCQGHLTDARAKELEQRYGIAYASMMQFYRLFKIYRYFHTPELLRKLLLKKSIAQLVAQCCANQHEDKSECQTECQCFKKYTKYPNAVIVALEEQFDKIQHELLECFVSRSGSEQVRESISHVQKTLGELYTTVRDPSSMASVGATNNNKSPTAQFALRFDRKHVNSCSLGFVLHETSTAQVDMVQQSAHCSTMAHDRSMNWVERLHRHPGMKVFKVIASAWSAYSLLYWVAWFLMWVTTGALVATTGLGIGLLFGLPALIPGLFLIGGLYWQSCKWWHRRKLTAAQKLSPVLVINDTKFKQHNQVAKEEINPYLFGRTCFVKSSLDQIKWRYTELQAGLGEKYTTLQQSVGDLASDAQTVANQPCLQLRYKLLAMQVELSIIKHQSQQNPQPLPEGLKFRLQQLDNEVEGQLKNKHDRKLNEQYQLLKNHLAFYGSAINGLASSTDDVYSTRQSAVGSPQSTKPTMLQTAKRSLSQHGSWLVAGITGFVRAYIAVFFAVYPVQDLLCTLGLQSIATAINLPSLIIQVLFGVFIAAQEITMAVKQAKEDQDLLKQCNSNRAEMQTNLTECTKLFKQVECLNQQLTSKLACLPKTEDSKSCQQDYTALLADLKILVNIDHERTLRCLEADNGWKTACWTGMKKIGRRAYAWLSGAGSGSLLMRSLFQLGCLFAAFLSPQVFLIAGIISALIYGGIRVYAYQQTREKERMQKSALLAAVKQYGVTHVMTLLRQIVIQQQQMITYCDCTTEYANLMKKLNAPKGQANTSKNRLVAWLCCFGRKTQRRATFVQSVPRLLKT